MELKRIRLENPLGESILSDQFWGFLAEIRKILSLLKLLNSSKMSKKNEIIIESDEDDAKFSDIQDTREEEIDVKMEHMDEEHTETFNFE